MGREQRVNEELRNIQSVLMEYYETSQGPPLPFAAYMTKGCPKCLVEPSAIQRKFCPGSHPETPDPLRPVRPESANIPIPCTIPHEHLHGLCRACGFAWVEHTAQSDPERADLT